MAAPAGNAVCRPDYFQTPHLIDTGMMNLCAITGHAAEAAALDNPGKHIRQSRRGDMFMSIQADQPVDSLFFEDPEVTLICRADLLAPERVTNVAGHLARLYRQEGDQFVACPSGNIRDYSVRPQSPDTESVDRSFWR